MKLVLPASLFGVATLAALYGCQGQLNIGDPSTVASASSAAPAASTAPPSIPAHIVGTKLPQMSGSQINVSGDIDFNTNSDQFQTDASNNVSAGTLQVLQQIAQNMADNPQITKLRVEGNTDNVGPPDVNKDLSNRRANTVVQWLSSTGKVDSARLAAVGCGAVNPIADNSTTDGQGKNRRTEFHVQETNNQPYAGDSVCGGKQ
jgi:outer membrane protein OmpA-like peptidoglycan-associated protein